MRIPIESNQLSVHGSEAIDKLDSQIDDELNSHTKEDGITSSDTCSMHKDQNNQIDTDSEFVSDEVEYS